MNNEGFQGISANIDSLMGDKTDLKIGPMVRCSIPRTYPRWDAIMVIVAGIVTLDSVAKSINHHNHMI